MIWNEFGLDPGVDHLYAIMAIDEIYAKSRDICVVLRLGSKW